MTTPSSRPTIVSAAFWCWVIAAAMLLLGGMLTASLNLPAIYRGAGILLALAGAGLAFLARRTRAGDERFRNAAVGLAFPIVILLALLAVQTTGIFWLIPLVLTVVGGVLIMWPSAQDWFGSKDNA
jgi:peptidoglycan/LPS O-acetylase OafA/YrhL